MTGKNEPAAVDGAGIRRAWDELLKAEPKLRPVDAAGRLGVTEGELIASRVGERAVALAGPYAKILQELPAVGEVMVLTRNPSAVHEKVGKFDKVEIGPGHGIVLNHDIDLRLFMSQWRSGFAFEQPLEDGAIRRSLQFFDRAGVAVHKVFARGDTDMAQWQAIIDRHRAPEQVDTIAVKPRPAAPADLADDMIDVETMRSTWADLQDTHDFFGMLRDLRVGRKQALRLAGPKFAERASLDSVVKLLEQAARSGVSIMCFVGNPGCIQIHTGPVSNVRAMGPWINVMDPKFNLHLRTDHVADAWVVRKPTSDGVVTSLEVFDEKNGNFAQFFGERKPGSSECEDWRKLVEGLVDRETSAA
ncbi:MAG: ChuX/HutX family heme-like substrate-binding protein [Burkholderiaceae bacterium]